MDDEEVNLGISNFKITFENVREALEKSTLSRTKSTCNSRHSWDLSTSSGKI